MSHSTFLKACLILSAATILFIYNNLAIVSGWMNPPIDHTPMLISRGGDTASYLTWMEGFRTQVFIPNYHVPWQTEKAYINPLLLMLSRFSTVTGMPLDSTLFAFHYLLYLLTALVVYYGLKTFTESAQQAIASLLVIFLSIPVTSWMLSSSLVLDGRLPWLPRMAGIGDFVFSSSDGFFHGISGSILVTFGTATMILFFTLLARYLKNEKTRYLILASVVAFGSAFVHPFEIVIMVTGGSLAVLIIHRFDWRKIVSPVAMIAGAGFLGVSIYLYQSWRFEWLREVAMANRWEPQNPARLLLTLGLPTIVLLILIITNPKTRDKNKILLRCWVLVSLLIVYIPWLPWAQHMFDGYFFGVGVLLVREFIQHPQVQQLARRYQKVFSFSLAILIGLSAITYSAFGWQSFKDGKSPRPQKLFSAVIHRDVIETISWLKHHADSEQLVISPLDLSPWFSTVPLHSMASHYLFSMRYDDQAKLVTQIYSGEMTRIGFDKFIDDLGVSFVVIRSPSPADVYFNGMTEKVTFGEFKVYEFPGNQIRSLSN